MSIENTQVLLAVSGIGKSFGDTRVLSDIAFEVRSGEVHALMGENGAGKSTLMKILAGVHSADEGTISINGSEVEFNSPADAMRNGVGIIHQELNVLPEMSIADNLALGAEPRTRLGTLDRARVTRDAREKLARVGSAMDPSQPMGSLSIGMQQLVEIARAVAEDSRVLILDEPTAALSSAEAERLFALIRHMRDEGMGLIYISHRMEEVWKLADRITVFRDGRHISTRDREAVTPQGVVADMIGRDLGDLYVREHREPRSGTGLLVRGLGDGRAIGPVDFEVRGGEIVGMFGLVGAGRTEIARLVYGADSAKTGEIRVAGKPVTITSPTDAIRNGIGLLTEDRKTQGILPDRGILDNIALPSLGRFQNFGILAGARIRRAVTEVADRLNIRRASLNQSITQLSGGNQQKAIIARWLEANPAVLILDEPTRGVDIGAKSEIYRTINELASAGMAVLVISSDLPEIIGMSDRVLVVRDGVIEKIIDHADATEETIMLHATGVARKESV